MQGSEPAGSFPNIQVVIQSQGTEAVDISTLIRSSFRSRHKDRCTIFADGDDVGQLLNDLHFQADRLEHDRNIHWTGRQARGGRKWKRVVVGDYFDWFIWYMQWQRFGAFHTIILINPIKYMLGADRKGYIDGLLTRLLTRGTLHRIIIIESDENRQRLQRWLSHGGGAGPSEDVTQFSQNELQQLFLSLLCGTRLTATQLVSQAGRSYGFSVNQGSDLRKEFTFKRWLYERTGPFYRLSNDGLRVLQSLAEVPDSRDGIPPEIDEHFRIRRKHQVPTLDKDWLKEQVQTVAQELGFFTVRMLTGAVNQRLLKMAKEGDFPSRIIGELEYMNDEDSREAIEPGPKLIRGFAEELLAEGMLTKVTWYLEVGRPAVLYALPGKAPMREEGRCGQCAFYVSVRRRCRLWWLLNQRIGHFPERWGNLTPPTKVSEFELYKMKNSGRISPHSSACQKFLDKKRDYLRKQMPENCDVCNQTLPKQRFAVCGTCRTRYAQLANGVRAYTAYEHEFRARYRELSGRDPKTDESEIYLRFSESGERLLEKQEFEMHRAAGGESYAATIMLFPSDPIEIRDKYLVVSRAGGKNSLLLEGLTVVDYGRLGDREVELLEEQGVTVRRVERYPQISAQLYHMEPALRESLDRLQPRLAHTFAIAMAKSAINATQRLATVGRLRDDLVQQTIRNQTWFLQRDESTSSQSGLLTNEAMIMKGYWSCYEIALDRVFAQFGPRKKSRFVREYAADPAGRAKGYTAVDAAINYLHQRRLLKCGLTNADLGLGWVTGDGILHRRSQNSRGMGLLLDLADPVKFADREILLRAFLDYRLNWRDFRLARDRKGVNYYYPSGAAVEILEEVGEEADEVAIEHGPSRFTLAEAYRIATKEFVHALRSEDVDSYKGLVFT